MRPAVSLLLSIVFTVPSCGSDSTSPIEPPPPSENTAETVIGIAGGVLEIDGFTLTVPSGALSSARTLKVSPSAEQGDYAAKRATNRYKLEGLPSSYGKPLRIRLELNGTPTNTSLLAIGSEALTNADAAPVTAFFYLDAVDSSGFLVATLEPPARTPDEASLAGPPYAANGDAVPVHLYGLTDMMSNRSTAQRFRLIHTPGAYNAAETRNLLESLDHAYRLYDSLGFEFKNTRTWPMTVEISNIAQDEHAVLVHPGDNNLAKLVLSHSIVGDEAAGSGFFFYVAHLYDKRSWLSKKLEVHPDHRWLVHAVETWSRQDIVQRMGKIFLGSWRFRRHASAPLDHGLHYAGADAVGHGHGMAGFIQWLMTNHEDKTLLKRIFDQIKGGVHVVKALADIVPGPHHEWVDKFFWDYCYHTNVAWYDPDLVFPNENMFFAGASDTLRSFTRHYTSLSAGWFQLWTSLVPHGAKIKFMLEGAGSESHVSVKYPRGGKTHTLGLEVDEIEIVHDRESPDWVRVYHVMVTHHNVTGAYDDSTAITLTIKVERETPITGVSAFLRYLTGDFIEKYSTGPDKRTENESFGMGFPLDDPDAQVQHTGNTVTQHYANYVGSDDRSYSRTITIVFNDEMDSVRTLDASWSVDISSTTRRENTLSATNIPLDPTVPFTKFRLAGTELCDSITTATWRATYSTYTKELEPGSWVCNKDSELEIFVSRQ